MFGFSLRQGPHHEAQKSTIVILPKLSFKEITFPSGLGAEKSALHLAPPIEGAAAGPPLSFAKASFIAFPGLEFCNFSSKSLNIFSAFLTSVLGSFKTP
jgi:hypothetical protein